MRFLAVEEVGRHQQLQTELRRQFHVGHVFCVLVLLRVVQVLAHFLEDQAVDLAEGTPIRGRFDEVAYSISESAKLYLLVR